MPKFSVINADTISKRVVQIALIGFGALGISMLPDGCRGYNKIRAHSARIEAVTDYIDKRNFEASRELLRRFQEDGVLEPADISKLEVRIKFEEEEFLKEEHRADLLGQVSNIENLNIEDSFLENLDFSGKSLEEALENVEDCFELGRWEEEVDVVLDGFYKFLKTKSGEELEGLDISGLKDISRDYILSRPNKYHQGLFVQSFGVDPRPVGTGIIIIRKLGDVVEGKKTYKYEDTPKEIPLFTRGTYTRDSHNSDLYHLINIGGKNYWFNESEIAEIDDLNRVGLLKVIKTKVKAIEDYVGLSSEGGEARK